MAKRALAESRGIETLVSPEGPALALLSEIEKELNALNALDVSPSIQIQIRNRTRAARKAADLIKETLLGFSRSEYFDPHLYAAELFIDRERKRKGAKKTNAIKSDNKKPHPPDIQHPRTEEAIQLLRQQKAIFPKDSISAFHAVAKAMGISMSRLEKEILTPARKLDLLPDYRKLPPL